MMYRYPQPEECAQFYHKYIEQLRGREVLQVLAEQAGELEALGSNVSEDQSHFRYGEDKWSIRQVAGHLADAERVFVYRAMCFARGDAGPLPSMDENGYAESANFDERTLSDIIRELVLLRESSVAFFISIAADEILRRRGIASGVQFTVNSMAYIVAGHTAHHLAILRERYLRPLGIENV